MLNNVTQTIDSETKGFILSDIYSDKEHLKISLNELEGFLVECDGYIYFVTNNESKQYYKFDSFVTSLVNAKRAIEFVNKSYEKGCSVVYENMTTGASEL
ncbi:hypothetical protein KY334_02555 [Candidatus Woesearchaeota archaeon]|nr:hypothetical protein [Candidatus Woesearchaeota archaeon]